MISSILSFQNQDTTVIITDTNITISGEGCADRSFDLKSSCSENELAVLNKLASAFVNFNWGQATRFVNKGQNPANNYTFVMKAQYQDKEVSVTVNSPYSPNDTEPPVPQEFWNLQSIVQRIAGRLIRQPTRPC